LPVFIINKTITTASTKCTRHFAPERNIAIPKILQGQQLCYLLEQLLIEGGEHLEILHENLHSLGPIMPVKPTANSAQHRSTLTMTKYPE